MNTLWTPFNGPNPIAKSAALNVRQACLFVSIALTALPICAYQAQDPLSYRNSETKKAGSSTAPVLVAQVIPRDPISGTPTPGDGFFTTPSPPPPASIPASIPAPLSAPPLRAPAPPALVPPAPLPAPVNVPPTPASVSAPAPVAVPAPVSAPVPVSQPARPEPRPSVGPTSSGATTSLLPSNTTPSPLAKMVEILPGVQKLSESMRELPATRQQSTEKDATTTVNSDKCVPVSLRPDSQRPGLSLVDLTGDGLIVSAVPDAHVQTVFTRAGYGQIDLSQTARWCIKQAAARALVRPSAGVGTSQAALLVQTGAGLQLMSQDQWLAHQASVKPLVTAMALSPKLTKSSKPTKLNKSTHRLVAKRSSKPVAGVAVSAARLPTATSKVSAGA